MDSPQLIGILVFLAFGAAIAAFFKKMVTKAGTRLQRTLGLGHTMSIRLKTGQSIEIKNVSITLNTDMVRSILKEIKQGVAVQSTLPEEKYNNKCEEYLKSMPNISRAKYAINTFKAYANGLMRKIAGIDEVISMEDFDEFVSNIYNLQKQDGIPQLKNQLNVFYSNCPPDKDEFIISYADRLVLTSRRMIITSEGSEPIIEHNIEVGNIEDYESSN